ncbi:NAD(P)/FAD-dependent oxidoreductase [Paracoccus marinus]|uniref:NAD(P)/FAD-dependent oxidoreductase n=1 Tax=Paracoccus marinus TaxID=288426 RepID=UPI00103F2E62|nr:FAD-dependent oxidoreductase [Paracoccus marinus]GLS80505.1 pyridine nucleotide-disulfide oxidoreductase [Paracoccus marinus]
MSHVVIVGAGQAGSALAVKLRALGHEGPVTLLGDEPALPYQRPPLSKKYLMGEMELDQLFLRPQRFYDEQGIRVLTEAKVIEIDRAGSRLLLDCGEVAYDQLALTTGAAPRALPAALGGNLPGVHLVRTLADVERMAPMFAPGRRVLIIGGGYIGLEAAAVASKLGLRVTLVEATARILQRVAAPQTSDYFRALHAAHGVEILEATGLLGMEQAADGSIAAHLGDGRTQVADFVIVGIGVVPNDALAARAGLACDGGIVVDAQGRTSDPTIWAAGDCARFPWRGQSIRLESVQNAIDQAEAVAANILGAGRDYAAQPWFWSDQYDVKLQIAGLNTGYDQVAVRLGTAPGVRSHWYFRGTELLAIDAMNDPRAYMVGKRLIEAGRSPRPAQVADADTDLKTLL